MRKNNPGSASLRAAARTKGRNSAEGHILLSPFFPILKRDAPHRGRAASCQSPTAAVSGKGEGRTLTQTDDGPLWMLSHSPDGHSWSGLLTRSLFISPTLWTRISSTSPSASYQVSLLTGRGSRVELLLHFSNGLTYHWGISEPLDSLKNATSYRSHRESTSAVIHDPPGTVTKNRDENAMLHHVTLCE